jgi:Flp pilus assembly protein CpaB
MNRKRGGMMLVSVGLLMAVIAGWLAYSQLKAAEKRVEQVPGVRVVVATGDIAEQGRIAFNNVTYATISEESLPARPITDIGQAVGQFARQRIFKGDIITADRVVSLEQVRTGGGGVAASPSLILDKDQVMMVLPAKMSGNVAGQSPNLLTTTNAIRAGDYVDVLVTTLEFPEGSTQQEKDIARRENPYDYLRTRVMFQNLRVHHIGAWPDPNQPAPAPARGSVVGNAARPQVTVNVRPEERYLTFVVDRETALQLKWLKDVVALGHANVDFVLRSPVNQEVQQSEALTVQDIRRQYGVYGGRPQQ